MPQESVRSPSPCRPRRRFAAPARGARDGARPPPPLHQRPYLGAHLRSVP